MFLAVAAIAVTVTHITVTACAVTIRVFDAKAAAESVANDAGKCFWDDEAATSGVWGW